MNVYPLLNCEKPRGAKGEGWKKIHETSILEWQFWFLDHCVGALDKLSSCCRPSHSLGACGILLSASWHTVFRLLEFPHRRACKWQRVKCVDATMVLTHQSPGGPSYKVARSSSLLKMSEILFPLPPPPLLPRGFFSDSSQEQS